MSSHLGLLVLVTFVWGLIAFAVAIDASRRGHHGGFWAVLTLFTGLFGAVLYVLVALTTGAPSDEGASEEETEPETVRICPTCSSECEGSQSYCDECGAELGPGDEHTVGRRLKAGSRRYCSNCKSEIERGASACPSCGAVF